MSHTSSQPPKAFAIAARAREQINSFKAHITQLARSENGPDREAVKAYAQHATRLDAHLQKAQATLTRTKPVTGRVPTRPTASTPPSLRAKRALSVLLTGLNSSSAAKHLGAIAGHDSPDITDEQRDRIVRRKTEAIIGKPVLLSATNKAKESPISDDVIAATLKRAARDTDLSLVQIASNRVLFECRNVFRAYMWFKQVDPPADKPAVPDARRSYSVPEHIAFFGIDERNVSRWSRSQYGVFNVVSERANAAIRFYMNREPTGEDAFVALVKWIARHKTLFTAKCEKRRIAFDASRGMFLPCCIYPFEEDASPRFTRGSIPLRQTSSNAAQPTVRLPSGAVAQQQAQAQAAQPSAANGVQHSQRTAQAAAAAAAAQQSRRQGQSVVKQQAVPVTIGPGRAAPIDSKAAQNRQNR